MPITLLLVDDQPMFLGALRDVLATMGEVRVLGAAQDAADCLRLLRELRPDVVLTDVRLPDLDGTELARRIKAEQPEVGIVMLSGFTDQRSRDRAVQAGATALLEKGRGLPDLLPAIRKAVHRDQGQGVALAR